MQPKLIPLCVLLPAPLSETPCSRPSPPSMAQRQHARLLPQPTPAALLPNPSTTLYPRPCSGGNLLVTSDRRQLLSPPTCRGLTPTSAELHGTSVGTVRRQAALTRDRTSQAPPCSWESDRCTAAVACTAACGDLALLLSWPCFSCTKQTAPHLEHTEHTVFNVVCDSKSPVASKPHRVFKSVPCFIACSCHCCLIQPPSARP